MDNSTEEAAGAETADADIVLKISSKDDPSYTKKVAGAISWRLRDYGVCRARAIKMDAVNTVVKALAVVNGLVSNAGMTFSLDPVFASVDSDGGGSPSTAVAVTIAEAPSNRPPSFFEFKVSGKSPEDSGPSSKLAGAIASQVRTGTGVILRCIGPSAVYRAVYASTIAKGFIFSNGMGCAIVPRWGSMPADDPSMPPISLIQIEFWGVPSSSV